MTNVRIGSNDAGFSGSSDVGEIDCAGDFTSSVTWTMNSVQTLDVGGDFDADVTVVTGLGAADEILVGKSLVSGADITLPPSGLAGQIVINNLDLGGTWDGTVTVGTTTLSGPGYTQTAASLGGGSAGVAGFDLHEESCDPVGGDDFSVFALPPELRLRHYGPVAFTGSTPV